MARSMEDIVYEEQQSLRTRMHDVSNRLTSLDMANENQDEKIDSMVEQIQDLRDMMAEHKETTSNLTRVADRLENNLNSYNKFMWLIMMAATGSITTLVLNYLVVN